MVTSCRSSFSSSYCRSHHHSDCPTKIRRSCDSALTSSSNYSGGENRTQLIGNLAVYEDSYQAVSPLGFCINEFLPLNEPAKKEPKQNKCVNFNIEKLSDDMLGMCLFNGFLDTFETNRLMVVNKRIRNIGLCQVQHLDMRRCETLTTEQVANIAASFQALTDLDFSYCPQFGGKDLEQIIPASRKLRHLLLKGTNVSEEALVYYLQQVHKYFGECCLETLDLSAISIEKSVLIGDVAAAAISKYCPNLKCLRLGWCKRLTNKGVNALTSIPRLSELDLSLTSINSQAYNDLLQIMGPRLEILDLSATSLFQRQCFSFPKMQRLSTFKLQFCQDITSTLLESIAQNASNLKWLDVKHSGSEGRVDIGPSLAMKLCKRGIRVEGAKYRRNHN